MAFREKSAWVMAAVMGVTGLYYLYLLLGAGRALGAAPPAEVSAAYVVFVVVGSVVAQIGLAVLSRPSEVEAPADEREAPLLHKAGARSGVVLATGLVCALGMFLWKRDGDMLFHLVLGSLIVAQIAEFLMQAVMLRRGS